jgi:hypothetical protein
LADSIPGLLKQLQIRALFVSGLAGPAAKGITMSRGGGVGGGGGGGGGGGDHIGGDFSGPNILKWDEGPRFDVRLPANLTVAAGQTAVLRCRVYSLANKTVGVWTK